MKVADVMTRGLDTVDPSATVQDAARQMAELDVGAIFVGSADKIEGVLTDRDIIIRVVVEGQHPANVSVRDVMTPEVVGCSADDTIEVAVAAMREGQFRRMPVFGEGDSPLGVVALSDLAKNLESPEKVVETIREIAEPHRSKKVPEVAPAEVEDAAEPEEEAARASATA